MSNLANNDPGLRAKTLKSGVAVLVATMVLAMWVSVGASIYFSRETALAKMTSDADNLALAFDDELTHTLNTVAGTMDAVANRMRAKRSDMNIYAWSYEIPIVTSPIIEATIIGPNGLLIASTKAPVIKPVDVSDLKHIRIQLDGKFKGLFIGPPVISRDQGADAHRRQHDQRARRDQGWTLSRCAGFCAVARPTDEPL